VKSQPFEPLDPALYREVVRRALAEDLGWGDVTTEATVDGRPHGARDAVAKRACVIAGLDVAEEVFRQLDPGRSSRWHTPRRRGPWSGDVVAVVDGRAAWLLTAERTALNFLQRLSGIATLTRRFRRPRRRPSRRARHAQDHADAARAREVRRARGRRHEPSGFASTTAC
jgi:nicotinate-nucleotide pyrophosphorylase